MWFLLACARPPAPPAAVEAPAPPPPPPAPVDPCAAPDRAVDCLARRVASAPNGCDGAGCVSRCAAHPSDPACAAQVDALRAACDRRDGAGCRALAHQLPADERPAALWAGCDANDGASCLFLAVLVAEGAPLPKAARGDVVWLWEQACDLQLTYACAGP